MTAITFSDEESLLRQMVSTIVSEVSPETIILFGSRARGNARPDSDVDLLVVESEPFLPQHSSRKEVARLYMALREGDGGFQGYSLVQPGRVRSLERFLEPCRRPCAL